VNGNLTTDDAWDTALADPGTYISSPFFLDKISYGGDTPNDIPPGAGFGTRASGVNRENYSVQWEGEIFIPQGDVTFWDGNDDYTQLVIDGEVLIDDTQWTSWDGVSDPDDPSVGSGLFTGTKSADTVEGLKGGWYPIQFRGGEGGGGDNFRLVWDASDGKVGQTGADVDADFANPNVDLDTFYTVASPFLRVTEPTDVAAITASTNILQDIVLGTYDQQGNPVGYIGTGELGSAGTSVDVPLNGAVIPFPAGELKLVLRATVGDTIVDHVEIFGGGSSGIEGDIDGNGKVDLTDFGILKENFGKSGGAAVPEPSSLLLLGLGGLMGLAALVRKRMARA
jgi:hypothetical protein